jgi:NAD(P)-dependent dehydrogenase (short-subunit alcohol dehydrogenase family)
MDLELTGKTAIVTGGSRGIGKAIARELAREGVDVALIARDQATLDSTAEELALESGRRMLAISADTNSDESVRSTVQQVADSFGRIDILVNCAARPGGQIPPPKLVDTSSDLLRDELNTKVIGYLRCAREVAPYMIRQGWGRIISISGLAARTTGNIAGSVRNVAVVALTKNLADELGRHGINATVVHPGLTRTEKTPHVIADRACARGISLEEAERQIANTSSLQRMVDATEIAYVVAFLASPKSAAINGDVIAAGGGSPQAIYY